VFSLHAAPSDPKIPQLAALPVFAGLPPRELARLAPLLDEVAVPAGRELIRRGAVGREFLFLVSGHVRVHRDGDTLALLGPGDLVGEVSLLRRERRNASVTTVTPVRALVGSAQVAEAVLHATPEVAATVSGWVAGRTAA
jgi:CRP-like cAMP-binding protein